jgi:hypothetical protein
MMPRLRFALFLSLFCISLIATAQPFSIRNGFLTGEQFLQMPEPQKSAYSMGLINGMLLAPLFGGNKSELQWFENCIKGMTSTQITAIFTKYLNDNPQEWHNTPHLSLSIALHKSCPR